MFEGLISLKTDVVFGYNKTCKLYVAKSFTRHYFLTFCKGGGNNNKIIIFFWVEYNESSARENYGKRDFGGGQKPMQEGVG